MTCRRCWARPRRSRRTGGWHWCGCSTPRSASSPSPTWQALKAVLAESRASSSLRLEAGGDLYFSFEQPPANVGEVLGLVVAALILLVAFGSLLAAGLPLAVALFGLLVGASSLPLLGLLIDIPVWAPVMAAMVGLGVGIDYALFLLSRHREYLAAGVPVAESVGRSLATAGQAVVFAGGTVVVSILGLAFAGLPFVSAAGVGISAVVLVMVLAAITLLPALLGLAGHRLRTRRPLLRLRLGSAAATRTRGRRRGAAVVALGCARHAARRGVRRRRHDAAPRARRARPRPAAGTAGPGQLPAGADREAGLRPGRRGLRARRHRADGRGRRRLAGPVGGGAVGVGPGCRPGHRVGRSRPGGGDVRRRGDHRPTDDDTTGPRDGPDAGPGAQRGAARRAGEQPGDRARRWLHRHHVRPQPAGRGTAADPPGRGRGDVVPAADGAVPLRAGAPQGSCC